MKYLFITIIFFYCSGCIKDYRSLYTATFINTTTHSINILFYKNGSVAPADTIKLLQGQEFEFAKGSVWGNVSVPGFTSKYFGSSDDSIIVVYDDLYKITHYANTPLQPAPKYYLFSSVRNTGLLRCCLKIISKIHTTLSLCSLCNTSCSLCSKNNNRVTINTKKIQHKEHKKKSF